MSEDLGVKALRGKSEAERIAMSRARKKYLFFGKPELVESIKLVHKPLIELSVKILQKKLFSRHYSESFIYFTPSLRVVDKNFKDKFDLSCMKDLSINEVRVLIQLLYNHNNTINKLEKATDLPDDDLRLILKRLRDDEFIEQSSWKGDKRVFKVVKKIVLPRIASLCSDKINTNNQVSDEGFFDKELFKRVVESLGSNVNITGSKVIYYPFYKVTLKRDMVSRELFINAVTGRIK
ncbi:hypothetical protein GF352_00460 [archaeon]|nr:hypothetical protein [archaeon]